MKCEYMHKTCESGCDNHECWAFFPLKQPLISKLDKDVCLEDDHTSECLVFVDGKKWREEKRVAGLEEKCPFANNNICGRPWEWWCKGGQSPFLLTTYEEVEGRDRIPKRDADRNVVFTHDDELIKSVCLSGDASIYTECPNYKTGMEMRELSNSLKSQKNVE